VSADVRADDADARRRLAGLLSGAASAPSARILPLRNVLLRTPARARERWNNRRCVAPGVDLILPRAVAAEFIEETLNTLPAPIRGRTDVVLLFLRRKHLRRPMFTIPDASSLVVFTMQPKVAPELARDATALIEQVVLRGHAVGATQYPAGWMRRDEKAWREHYGSRWGDVQDAKRRLDPHGVFGSAGVRFATAPQDYATTAS
jgi:hypothetical protein